MPLVVGQCPDVGHPVERKGDPLATPLQAAFRVRCEGVEMHSFRNFLASGFPGLALFLHARAWQP
jgi:hypothetical protein